MKIQSLTDLKVLSLPILEKIPYLKMLVLFGSRARGDNHAKSDWDFAALYDEEIQKEHIKDNAWAWFELPRILGEYLGIPDNQVDVVELNKTSPLIAHFVARDGELLHEKENGEFERFQQQYLKGEREMQEVRKALRGKIEAHLQRWGV